MKYLTLLFLIIYTPIKAQYHDAKWVLCSGNNQYYNNVILDFNNGQTPVVNVTSKYVPMSFENASICDSVGNLLFYTNGYRLFDRNLDFIPGGYLVPPMDTNGMFRGTLQARGCMFLPWPGDTNRYVLLHTTKEFTLPIGTPGWISYILPRHLYYSVFDKTLNNGNGGFIGLNQIIVTDTLTNWGGGLAVTKHANGRDWWIMVKKHYKNRFYKFLLTPAGIQPMGYQLIGLDNQARLLDIYCFSPNGEIVAGNIGFSGYAHDIVLMNFDRCTGLLSNHQIISNPNNPNHGCEDADFSPDSRFLYSTERVKIFQYDLLNIQTPGAVQASRTVVADTAFSTSICDTPSITNIKTQYPFGALAADGRIYYPPSYGCQELSYFNAPDSSGLASDFIYGGLNIVNQHFASTPYYPNYRLGPVAGSVCDTLSVGVEEWQASQVSIFPNPTQNSVNVSLGRTCEEIQCNFYNMQGQMLFQEKRNFGNAFTLDIPNLSKGLYLLEILCNEGRVVKKVVVN